MLNILRGKFFHAAAFFGDNFIGEGFFSFLQVEDFIFDGILANHAVGKHFLFLPDAMSSVYGLTFHRRVPPWVYQKYVVGCR